MPYGTTWEELELKPYASDEEIEQAYDDLSKAKDNEYNVCMTCPT